MIKKTTLISLTIIIAAFATSRECFGEAAANFEQAKQNVIVLLDEGKFEAAMTAADKLISDFPDNQNMPQSLFSIGQNLCWRRKYSQSKDVFEQLIQKYPGSSYSRQARLWLAKSNICLFIVKPYRLGPEQTKNEQILADFEAMIRDFNNEPGLDEAMYWVGKELEWTKGKADDRTGWFSTSKTIFNRITQKFGGNEYGQKVIWDNKRLDYRMKIFNLIKEGDQSKIDAAIEQFVSDFSGKCELAGELYWISFGYEEQDKFTEATKILKKITTDFPNTFEAGNAVIDMQGIEIWNRIKQGDINEINAIPAACFRCVAMNCFIEGTKLQKKKEKGKASWYLIQSEILWKRIIEGSPGNPEEAYYHCAQTSRQLGKSEDAIAYYQKIVNDYPDFENADAAQCAVGWCYEAMRNAGKISKEEANPLIERAYKNVVDKYPYSYTCDIAAYRLGEICVEKGDKANAVIYYNKFIQMARPGDSRTAKVQAIISNLEGTNK